MKTRPIAFGLLLALTPAVVAVPRVAHAQASDDASTKAARARFQEGVEFFDKGQFENARAAFLQAYALRKHPAVLLNLAQSSLRSGHPMEASRFFQQYLREHTGLTPQQRNDAEKGLSDARAKLGHISVDAPAGVEITVDDDRAGNAPLKDPVDVEPGTHTVHSHGRTDDSTTVTVAAGQQVTAHVGQAPPPVAAPVPVAAAEPEAAAPPPPPEPVKEAPPPPPPPVAAKPSSSSTSVLSPPSNLAPVVVGGVLAVGGFATAIVFAAIKSSAQTRADGVSSQIRSDVIANNTNGGNPAGVCISKVAANVTRYGKACSALSDDNNAVNADATIANIGLGVGIAASAFTIIYWLAAHKDGDSPPSTSWALSPEYGGGTSGLRLSGQF